MYRALDDEGIYHWWVIDLNGKLIDLTSEQYTSTGRTPPHDAGTKASILGFDRKTIAAFIYQYGNSDWTYLYFVTANDITALCQY